MEEPGLRLAVSMLVLGGAAWWWRAERALPGRRPGDGNHAATLLVLVVMLVGSVVALVVLSNESARVVAVGLLFGSLVGAVAWVGAWRRRRDTAG